MLSLAIHLDLGEGRMIRCSFTGGINTPQRITGSFVTEDPIIQRAMEAHPWFNKDFYLFKASEVRPPAVQQKPEPEPQPELPVEVESGATGAQEAREELNKKYGVPFSRLRNAEAIRKEADELGVKYPQWVA